MNELSLFSGAGGGLLGTKLLGWSHVGYVENEKYCQQVIAQRIEDGCLDAAPIFGDIDEFVESGAAKKYQGFVDVLTAGFPCQPFSKAGKQKGGKDPRNKWPATIQCIRDVGPRYALLENVPALLNSGYFPEVLGSLAEAGYDARWTVLGASDVGAPHRRKRLWILAYPNSKRLEEHGHGKSANAFSASEVADSDRGACSEGQSRRASEKLSQESPRLRGGSDQGQAGKVVGSGSQDSGHQGWTTEPSVGRVANGVASRVDRLKALGNGQVPAVAAAAWEILNENGSLYRVHNSK